MLAAMPSIRNPQVASGPGFGTSSERRADLEGISRDVLLPSDPDVVWAALTDPLELAQWFGASVEMDLRPGGRALFRWQDGTSRPAVLEEVEPPRRLVFRWLPFERLDDGTVLGLPSSRVELALESQGQETRLTVVEVAAS